MRKGLGRRTLMVVRALLLCLIVYNLYAFTRGGYDIFGHMVANLVFILPLGLILFPQSKDAADRVGWYDYLLATVSFVVGFVFWYNYYDWIFDRMWLASSLSTEQIVFGVTLPVLILELVKRCYGKPLFLLVLVFLVYGVLYPYLPLRI